MEAGISPPDSTDVNADSKRVLGIDGGGTKTEWTLAEVTPGGSLHILSEGRLPGSNLRLVSDDELKAIFGAMPKEATHVGAYLAGCAHEEDRRRLSKLVSEVWPGAKTAVGSDRDSAFETAFGEGDGIIAIAGTGAVVHGRRGGRVEKAGGWGQLLGDRGSAYHLAMQGLRTALSDFDTSGEVTAIGHEFLLQLGLNRLDDLVNWAMRAGKMEVAQLAPAVLAAARGGDAEMLAIVRHGAETLAGFTAAVAKRLGGESFPVKLCGGLFTHVPLYRELYAAELATRLPGAEIGVCEASASRGALTLAWRATGEPALTASPLAAPMLAAAETRSELASAVTEQRNERSADLDRLSTANLVALFIEEEDLVGAALRECAEEIARAVELAADAITGGGRLFYAGAGTSGRLGVLDASEIPPTFGVSPELVQGVIAGGPQALLRAVEGAEDQPEAGALMIASRGAGRGDAVCGIAASGRTPFVLGALREARARGAATILLTCNPMRKPTSPTPWDVEIDLPTGPELITGSTRLKAGTATKRVLNILSSAAMIRLGCVRGNLMVNVQATNEKLKDRATRLVSTLTGAPYAAAAAALAEADWNVRRCLLRMGA